MNKKLFFLLLFHSILIFSQGSIVKPEPVESNTKNTDTSRAMELKTLVKETKAKITPIEKKYRNGINQLHRDLQNNPSNAENVLKNLVSLRQNWNRERSKVIQLQNKADNLERQLLMAFFGDTNNFRKSTYVETIDRNFKTCERHIKDVINFNQEQNVNDATSSSSSVRSNSINNNSNYSSRNSSNTSSQNSYVNSVATANRNINATKQALNSATSQIHNYFNARNARIQEDNDRRMREYRANLERERERESERERERERVKEEQRKTEAKYSFMSSLKDHNMPLIANQNITYFIIVVKKNEEEIQFSKLKLTANSQNELPYKIDVINEFKKKTNTNNVYLYGPYSTYTIQNNKVSELKRNARNNYVSIGSDIFYEHPISNTNTNNQSNDFWGNKKTPVKAEKKTNFWD